MNPINIIVSTNSDTLISNWINRIFIMLNNTEYPYSITIIDDGLTDKCKESIHTMENFSDLNILSGMKPFNFSRNINLGILFKPNHDCLIINDDCLLLSGGFLENLNSIAVEQPNVGMIFANNHPADEHNYVGAKVWDLREETFQPFVFVYITRKAIDRVGLLDESFEGYGWEDRDMCRRVRQAGFRLLTNKFLKVYHPTAATSFKKVTDGGTKMYRDFNNEELFARKWGR